MPTLLDSFPVGTIIPYFGSNSFTELLDLFWAGWVPCDGTAYSGATTGPHALPELAQVLELTWGGRTQSGHVINFNVPSLQSGEFLRGTNYQAMTPTKQPVDPDVGDRSGRNGGYAGNHVGSFQGWATGMPANEYTTTGPNLQHQHNINHYFNPDSVTECWGGGDDHFLRFDYGINIDPAGDHIHSVSSGGDPLTRPRCASVYFLIKYADISA